MIGVKAHEQPYSSYHNIQQIGYQYAPTFNINTSSKLSPFSKNQTPIVPNLFPHEPIIMGTYPRLNREKEPSKGVQAKKYMWLFAGGPASEFVYYYQYHPSRSHEVAANFFEDFNGFIHCDGFAAYDSLARKNPNITLVGCLYHARRKFVEIAKLMPNKEGVATHVIKLIAKLAAFEEEGKHVTLSEKQSIRQNKSAPLLNDLHQYLIDNQLRIPPKSLLGQAVSYTLNQWPKILNYLKDPRLDISNNLSERAIKPFVIGRNYAEFNIMSS